MKTETAEIKKIVLDIAGKEIILTVDQAKKLKEVLSDMFGKEIIKEVRIDHHYKHYDWTLPRPYYLSDNSSKFTLKDNAVYCSAI